MNDPAPDPQHILVVDQACAPRCAILRRARRTPRRPIWRVATSRCAEHAAILPRATRHTASGRPEKLAPQPRRNSRAAPIRRVVPFPPAEPYPREESGFCLACGAVNVGGVARGVIGQHCVECGEPRVVGVPDDQLARCIDVDSSTPRRTSRPPRAPLSPRTRHNAKSPGPPRRVARACCCSPRAILDWSRIAVEF